MDVSTPWPAKTSRSRHWIDLTDGCAKSAHPAPIVTRVALLGHPHVEALQQCSERCVCDDGALARHHVRTKRMNLGLGDDRHARQHYGAAASARRGESPRLFLIAHDPDTLDGRGSLGCRDGLQSQADGARFTCHFGAARPETAPGPEGNPREVQRYLDTPRHVRPARIGEAHDAPGAQPPEKARLALETATIEIVAVERRASRPSFLKVVRNDSKINGFCANFAPKA